MATASTSTGVSGLDAPLHRRSAGCPRRAPFEDRSPLDWNWKLADVASGDADTAAAAVAAATAAFPAWADLGPAGRAPYLHRLADLIDENIEMIAAVETVDMAMLQESLRLRVIARGARNFRAYATLAEEYTERVWSSNGTDNRVRSDARRAHRGDHPVERAVHALHVEVCTGSGRRQHRGPQACRMVATLVLAARRSRP